MKTSSGSWPSHQGGKHERAFMNARNAPAHAYTCHSEATLLNADWLSSREIRVKVEIFQLERICRCTNPRERARLCTAKVWRDKSKLVAGFLSRKIRPIRVSTFTCMGSCRPVAFGVNAKKWTIWLADTTEWCASGGI